MFTFQSKPNHSRSHIDHFIVTENMSNKVVNCEVIHEGSTLSDHSPLVMQLTVNVTHYVVTNDNVKW